MSRHFLHGECLLPAAVRHAAVQRLDGVGGADLGLEGHVADISLHLAGEHLQEQGVGEVARGLKVPDDNRSS